MLRSPAEHYWRPNGLASLHACHALPAAHHEGPRRIPYRQCRPPRRRCQRQHWHSLWGTLQRLCCKRLVGKVQRRQSLGGGCCKGCAASAWWGGNCAGRAWVAFYARAVPQAPGGAGAAPAWWGRSCPVGEHYKSLIATPVQARKINPW